MGKIIIIGKIKEKICIDNETIKIVDSLNDISGDFILQLFNDIKNNIKYDSDTSIETHSKNFSDEILRYAKRKIRYENREFVVAISRRTYGSTILIEIGIEYDDNEVDSNLFSSIYSFKMQIKEWIKKICKPVYWIQDDNNSMICSNAYIKIYNIENKFRQILSIFMMRKCGDIYLTRDLNEQYTDYSRFYNENAYIDFKDINTKLFNIDFLKLPNLLDMNISQAVIEEKGTIKQLVDEIILLLSDVGNVTYEYKEIDQMKKRLNSEINKINTSEHIFDENILSVLNNDFREKWNRLSGMRNMVMHNKPICKFLHSDIEGLCEEIEEKFNKCLSNIEMCFYTEEEYIYDCLCDESAESDEYEFEFIEQERENRGIQFRLDKDYVIEYLSEECSEISDLITELQSIKEVSSQVEDIFIAYDNITEYLKKDNQLIEKIEYITYKFGLGFNGNNCDVDYEDIIEEFMFALAGNYNLDKLYNDLDINSKIEDYYSVDKSICFKNCEGNTYEIKTDEELDPQDDSRDYIEITLYKDEEVLKKAVLEVDYGSYEQYTEGDIHTQKINIIIEELGNIHDDMKSKLDSILSRLEGVEEILNIK